jgi:hypothetical protein
MVPESSGVNHTNHMGINNELRRGIKKRKKKHTKAMKEHGKR